MRAALVKVMLVRGVLPPTAPEKVTVPVPARRVNEVAPFRVVEKLILAPAEPPALVVSNVGVFVIATAPVMVTAPFVVVMLPLTLIAVDPV